MNSDLAAYMVSWRVCRTHATPVSLTDHNDPCDALHAFGEADGAARIEHVFVFRAR